MPKYVISSDSPISARPIIKPEWEFPEKPTDPGWGIEEGEFPDTGGPPLRPGHPIRPTLPPRDQWPSLPPDLELPDLPSLPQRPAFPIPPSPEHPMVPLPPEVDPPGIWPPVRPELPDLSGKSLALAYVFVSRHVSKLCWVVIDHEEAKAKFKEAADKIKDKLPRPGQGLPGSPGIPDREPKR